MAASDESITVKNGTNRISATDSDEHIVSFSATLQNKSSFPNGEVFSRSGYFIQSLTLSDSHGLSIRIVTMQEHNCEVGLTVSNDNETCVRCTKLYTSEGGAGLRN